MSYTQETCALEVLNLMCNELGPEGAKHIAKGLQVSCENKGID